MRTLSASLVSSGKRFGIVVARFNSFITQSLLDGCVDALERHGVDSEAITVAWVPGGFEIGLLAKRMAASDQFDAVICLGAVVRGSTPHFDYVATQAARGVAQASMDTGKPVIFGVLTTDTLEQAIERAGTKAGNKGADAGVAAIEMVNLLEQLDS